MNMCLLTRAIGHDAGKPRSPRSANDVSCWRSAPHQEARPPRRITPGCCRYRGRADFALQLGGAVYSRTEPVGRLPSGMLGMVAEYEADIFHAHTQASRSRGPPASSEVTSLSSPLPEAALIAAVPHRRPNHKGDRRALRRRPLDGLKGSPASPEGKPVVR